MKANRPVLAVSIKDIVILEAHQLSTELSKPTNLSEALLSYLDVMQNEILHVERMAQNIAKAIKKNVHIEESENFIAHFIFPYVARYKTIRSANKKGHISTLSMATSASVCDETKITGFNIDKAEKSDVLCVASSDLKFVDLIRLFGRKTNRVTLSDKISIKLTPDNKLRSKIKEMVSSEQEKYISERLPLTMLEGLVERIYKPFPFSKVIFYYSKMTKDESLIYALTYSRLNYGAKIIGIPHGGYYYQISYPATTHVIELYQCDVYFRPKFATGDIKHIEFKSFPMRRGMVLYIKNMFRLRTKRQQKNVAVLPQLACQAFSPYSHALEGLLKKLIKLKSLYPDLLVKLHPNNQKYLYNHPLVDKISQSFDLVDAIDISNDNLFLFGEFHTLLIEASACRETINIVSLADFSAIDKGFARVILDATISFDREYSLTTLDCRKIKKAYGISVFGFARLVFNYCRLSW